MAIEAIVRNEKLCTGADGLFVTLMRIFDGDRFDAERKSSRKILIVLNEVQAIARYREIADILL